MGRIASGADPAAERQQAKAAEARQRNMPTIAELAERFLTEYVQLHDRPRTITEYRRLFERHVIPRLGAIKVPDVTPEDVAALHGALRTTPYVANRVLAVLSKMFNLAAHTWRLRPDNPVIGLRRYAEERRQRFLAPAEIGRLAEALAAHSYPVSAGAIRLLLLTGARRGEVLGMRWDQLEAGCWVKPSALTKQRKVHRVPLSAGAWAVLEQMQRYRKPGETFVFPGAVPGKPLAEIKKSWRSICTAAGIAGVRLHDLRHTYASILASSGLGLPIIGGLLGHTQAQTTLRYAHLATDALQAAADRADAAIAAASTGHTAEVATFRKR
jgi:integrase